MIEQLAERKDNPSLFGRILYFADTPTFIFQTGHMAENPFEVM